MPELLAVLNAIYEKEKRNNKFMAALQGVDIEKDAPQESKKQEDSEEEKATTMNDIYARVAARLGGSPELVEMAKLGLTPDMGTGYELWEDNK